MAGQKEKTPCILLVDDDQHLLQSMGEWLNACGYPTSVASNLTLAEELLQEQSFDLALIDVRLGPEDGFELLGHCKTHYPNTTVILMTGYATIDTGIEAIRAGAFDLVTKPLIDEELLMSVKRALSQKEVIEENIRLKTQLDRPIRFRQHHR